MVRRPMCRTGLTELSLRMWPDAIERNFRLSRRTSRKDHNDPDGHDQHRHGPRRHQERDQYAGLGGRFNGGGSSA